KQTKTNERNGNTKHIITAHCQETCLRNRSTRNANLDVHTGAGCILRYVGRGNQLWTVELDNSNNAEAAAVAIYSMDKMGKAEYFQIATLPGSQLVTLTVTKVPKGTPDQTDAAI